MELLTRRPALRAGSARLAEADERFAAALADRWPQLSLSAGGLTRAISGDVTSIVNAAIDATLTLVDSGRKIAIAEQRRAQLVAVGQQLLNDWIQAVVEADTLIYEEHSLRDRIALSEQRLVTAEALLKAAQRRYERGVSDYLPVLAALRGLQQQQRDHLALQAELARVRIRLHHALGHAPNRGLV
jgi:outer membrane protein TolC